MSEDVVRARIDPKLKKKANRVLKQVGLTTSGAFRLLMVKIAEENKLPFEPFVPNKKTIAAMKEARRGGLRSVKSVPELWKALDAEDD